MNHVWLHVHPDEIDYRVDRVDSISIRLPPSAQLFPGHGIWNFHFRRKPYVVPAGFDRDP